MIYLTQSDLKIQLLHLVLLHSLEVLDLYLLTFCACNDVHAIAKQTFGEGFIPLPITCSRCGKEHHSYDDLRFNTTFLMRKVHDTNNSAIAG
jgi:hypothetical protein